MRGEQVVDVVGQHHPPARHHDEVVTDPLDVGDEVGRQHHRQVVLGDRFHEVRQELAARQRVEARHRLVEDEQLGSLGERERQRELGALTAGQPARALARVEPETVDARMRPARRPIEGCSARRGGDDRRR